MAYVADVKAAQESLARLRALRAQDEAVTMERVQRLRRFEQDWDRLQSRERAEWEAFHLRVAPLEREIDVITGLLVDALEPPSITVRL